MRQRKTPGGRSAQVLCGIAVLAFSVSAIVAAAKPPAQVPEFTQSGAAAWINSAPLTTDDLRGQVVLLDVWTFACWNCYRSIPWLKSLERRYEGRPFRIIGIHTPEFGHERKRDNVVDEVAKFGITHPVMMDNDFGYWKALDNRYWPAFYVIDADGKIQGYFVGETHAGDKRATNIEALLDGLLKAAEDQAKE